MSLLGLRILFAHYPAGWYFKVMLNLTLSKPQNKWDIRREQSVITTQRLDLVPATIGLIYAALEENTDALSAGLGAVVPSSWPPEFLDRDAFLYVLERLKEAPEQAEWWFYFVLLRGNGVARALIGSAGYKGSPSEDGTVEIGYGIVQDQQRRGYASEAAQGLIDRAFSLPNVNWVIAETLPELEGSIGVLRKLSFVLIESGSEPGVIRFELKRTGGL